MTADDAKEWIDDDDDEQEDFPVHPDNVLALRVFIVLESQWRVVCNMSGLIYLGLDYSVLNEVWERMHVKVKDRDKVFHQLRIMERAARPIRNGKEK